MGGLIKFDEKRRYARPPSSPLPDRFRLLPFPPTLRPSPLPPHQPPSLSPVARMAVAGRLLVIEICLSPLIMRSRSSLIESRVVSGSTLVDLDIVDEDDGGGEIWASGRKGKATWANGEGLSSQGHRGEGGYMGEKMEGSNRRGGEGDDVW